MRGNPRSPFLQRETCPRGRRESPFPTAGLRPGPRTVPHPLTAPPAFMVTPSPAPRLSSRPRPPFTLPIAPPRPPPASAPAPPSPWLGCVPPPRPPRGRASAHAGRLPRAAPRRTEPPPHRAVAQAVGARESGLASRPALPRRVLGPAASQWAADGAGLAVRTRRQGKSGREPAVCGRARRPRPPPTSTRGALARRGPWHRGGWPPGGHTSQVGTTRQGMGAEGMGMACWVEQKSHSSHLYRYEKYLPDWATANKTFI